jgi:hypothetical protein
MAAQPDGLTKLINRINKANLTNFTPAQLLISPPQVNTNQDINANTVVSVRPTVLTAMNGFEPVYYNRKRLSDWVAQVSPLGIVASITGIGTIAELLVVLNNQYNGGFTLQDFADGPLPVGTYPFNFIINSLPTSYSYTGSLLVTLANNVVPISEVITNNVLGDLDCDGSTPPASGWNPPASGDYCVSGPYVESNTCDHVPAY